MSMTQLIAPLLPALAPSDSGTRALELMEENDCTQLPLVSDDHYLALIQEKDLLDTASSNGSLGELAILAFRPAILSTAHPYEALRLMNQLNLSVLPIMDFDQRYIGSITRESMLKYLAESSGTEVPGGIIVLQIEPRNYSLYEIARICENEDVLILNTQLFTTPDGTMELTIKTNRTALEAVISSFERHEYRIKEVYGDTKSMEDVMGKYNLLMNYLNM